MMRSPQILKEMPVESESSAVFGGNTKAFSISLMYWGSYEYSSAW